MTITIETGITIGQGIVMGSAPMVYPLAPRSVGVIAQGRVSTAQVKFGTGSYSSGASNGGLRVTPVTGFGFGLGDFTIEYWYYPTSFVDSLSVDMRSGGSNGPYPAMGPFTSGAHIYYVSGQFRITTATNVTPLNTWNSVALVRNAGNTRMYINGVQSGVTYADNTNYLTGTCTIACGYSQTGTNPIRGFLDEIRISNVARYTGTYTPATQPFESDANTLLLIHCDGVNGSVDFVDASNSV